MEEQKEVPLSNNFNDWKWQLRNRITTKEELIKYVELNKEEEKAFEKKLNINFSITPYYLNIIKNSKELRKCVIPNINEFIYSNYESDDPLCEEKTNPVRCIVHRYPDRVLFLTTDFCSIFCRYCTRSRLINNMELLSNEMYWIEALTYINDHKDIRDVVISGGDPLTLSTKSLNFILGALYGMNHIKIIRIGTKVPVVLPQRIDDELLRCLEKYWQKLFINIHFTHFDELTSKTKSVCWDLAKLGIPLGSQTVLLKDVNDNIETMKKLMQGLLECKVIPRYLYSMDRILGSGHFFVPIEKGIEIIKGIQGHTSGMACPKYVIDSEQGKIPVDIGRTVKIREGQYLLTNYENKEVIYYE